MRETAPELEGLQALIDRSLAQTRPHMRAIVHPGKYSPNGDPLVAPMDGWFVHGKFYFSSSGDAVRIRGLRKRPRASIAYFEAERFLINAHGHAELMFKGHPEVTEIDAIFGEHYGSSAFDWSDEGVYVRLDADRFYTYSRTPDSFET